MSTVLVLITKTVLNLYEETFEKQQTNKEFMTVRLCNARWPVDHKRKARNLTLSAEAPYKKSALNKENTSSKLTDLQDSLNSHLSDPIDLLLEKKKET